MINQVQTISNRPNYIPTSVPPQGMPKKQVMDSGYSQDSYYYQYPQNSLWSNNSEEKIFNDLLLQRFAPQKNYNSAFSIFENKSKAISIDFCPWVTDPELKLALNKLGEITHDPNDVQHIRNMGINIPFNSGMEAVDFITKNNIKIEFADFEGALDHARYDNANNKMLINQQYKGKMTEIMALAMADALYHETGHSKDRDGVTSIQEELECLALNVLGYRYQKKHYLETLAKGSDSRLISDGVRKYEELFFDPDPEKKALIERVALKYGFLDLCSENHEIPKNSLCFKIKELHMKNNPQDYTS